MRRALAQLPSQDVIDSILAAIDDSLSTLDEDRREAELPTARFDLGEWKEGTEMYSTLNDLAVDDMLGIVDAFIEGMNRKQDPDGLTDPWTTEGKRVLESTQAIPLRLRWHQRVGALRIQDRMFERAPLLLMDEVGVGKTAQAIATIALYARNRAHFNKTGHFPGKFRKWVISNRRAVC